MKIREPSLQEIEKAVWKELCSTFSISQPIVLMSQSEFQKATAVCKRLAVQVLLEIKKENAKRIMESN